MTLRSVRNCSRNPFVTIAALTILAGFFSTPSTWAETKQRCPECREPLPPPAEPAPWQAELAEFRLQLEQLRLEFQAHAKHGQGDSFSPFSWLDVRIRLLQTLLASPECIDEADLKRLQEVLSLQDKLIAKRLVTESQRLETLLVGEIERIEAYAERNEAQATRIDSELRAADAALETSLAKSIAELKQTLQKELGTYQELIDGKIETVSSQTGSSTNELSERLSGGVKRLDRRIDDQDDSIDDHYSWFLIVLNIYFGVPAVILALISWLGRDGVAEWLRSAIRRQVKEIFGERAKELINEAATPIIEQQAGPTIEEFKLDLWDKSNETSVEMMNLLEKGEKDLQEWKVEAQKQLTLMAQQAATRLILMSDSRSQDPEQANVPDFKKRVEEFVESLNEIKDTHELDSEDWFLTGVAAFSNTNWEQACAAFKEALKNDEENPSILNYIGSSLEKQGKDEEAIPYYTKAIELNEDYYVYHLNRAISYHGAEQYPEAIAGYEKAKELQPKTIFAYQGPAEIFIITGQPESAIDQLDQAEEITTTTVDKATDIYLRCIATKLSDLENDALIDTLDASFEAAMQTSFKRVWSVKEIERWLETAELDDDTRQYIEDKTRRFKEK